MRGIKTVFGKEIRRIFYDPKMIFALFILPVIIMVGMYSLIGQMSKKFENDIVSHKSVVYVRNMDGGLEQYFNDFKEVSDISTFETDEELTDLKSKVIEGDIDLILDFPQGFMADIESYDVNKVIPDISAYYNPTEDNSKEAYERFNNNIEANFKSEILKQRIADMNVLTVYSVNADNQGEIFNEQKASGKMLSRLLPYLITMLLFSTTMNLGADAFAGEKERGTMASLLLTPVRRTDIVLGKLLALTVTSLVSAIVYIVSMSFSLPAGMGTSDTAVSFGANQVLMIAGIMLSLAFFYVALVATISVLAKNVKEAGMYVTPIYIIVIVAGMMTMFSGNSAHKVYEYAIPVYGSALSLGQVLVNELTMTNFGITIASTIVMALLASCCIAALFNNEKVMFNA